MKFCINHPTRRAINMRYCLCDECNFKRTHKGLSRFYINKNKLLIKKDIVRILKPFIGKKNNKKNRTSIRKISSKQLEIKIRYRQTCEEIDHEREHICTGCGTNQALCHSHLISQKDCKLIGKPELIYDKRDITFHCMSPVNNCCSQKWESKDPKIMSTLLDYEVNIAFVKSQSLQLYNQIINNC